MILLGIPSGHHFIQWSRICKQIESISGDGSKYLVYQTTHTLLVLFPDLDDISSLVQLPEDIITDPYHLLDDPQCTLVATFPNVTTTCSLKNFFGNSSFLDDELMEDLSISEVIQTLQVENTQVAAKPDARRMVTKYTNIRDKKRIECRPDILFCIGAWNLCGKEVMEEIMGMFNFLSTDIQVTYSGVEPVQCNPMELRSRMLSISRELHDMYCSSMTKEKIDQVVLSHEPGGRMFSESGITSVLYESYVSKCVCVKVGDRSIQIWKFDGNLWKEVSASEIWMEISEPFIKYLESHEMGLADEEHQRMCKDIRRYMGSVASRERIQKDIVNRLVDNTFLSKLNSNPGIIGMSEGVYDINRMELRQALPGDYISMSTHVKFPITRDVVFWERYRSLNNILETIFPDRTIKKFFIQSCASLLEGRNKDKYVYIWWGKGNNGKSMVEKLVAITLGDYSTVAATSLVTGKRSSADTATPQLSALEGKLAVFLQEPNPDETIKIGAIKELSGNDTITARALFRGNRTFVPKFKLVIVCNNTIEIPNIDVAFRNRLVVIPFVSTFLTKDDYKKKKKNGKISKHDHLMDTEIGKDIGNYADVFMYMLGQEYPKIRNLSIPKIISQTTLSYIEENNYCLKYIRHQAIKDESSRTDVGDLYSEFSHWMKSNYPSSKRVPNVDNFIIEIVNEGYEISSKMVKGLVPRNV
jgi:P4 family phage/plasmid primase-like protien